MNRSIAVCPTGLGEPLSQSVCRFCVRHVWDCRRETKMGPRVAAAGRNYNFMKINGDGRNALGL